MRRYRGHVERLQRLFRACFAVRDARVELIDCMWQQMEDAGEYDTGARGVVGSVVGDAANGVDVGGAVGTEGTGGTEGAEGTDGAAGAVGAAGAAGAIVLGGLPPALLILSENGPERDRTAPVGEDGQDGVGDDGLGENSPPSSGRLEGGMPKVMWGPQKSGWRGSASRMVGGRGKQASSRNKRRDHTIGNGSGTGSGNGSGGGSGSGAGNHWEEGDARDRDRDRDSSRGAAHFSITDSPTFDERRRARVPATKVVIPFNSVPRVVRHKVIRHDMQKRRRIHATVTVEAWRLEHTQWAGRERLRKSRANVLRRMLVGGMEVEPAVIIEADTPEPEPQKPSFKFLPPRTVMKRLIARGRADVLHTFNPDPNDISGISKARVQRERIPVAVDSRL